MGRWLVSSASSQFESIESAGSKDSLGGSKFIKLPPTQIPEHP
jgi:hypothetical protein